MLKKLPAQPQLEMFKTVLISFIHPEHELCLLAKKIDWKKLEEEFTPLYGKVGRPSISIRIIVGAMAVEGNSYDGHTLKPQLEQVKKLTGGKIKKAIVDKGYKVKGGIQGVDIVMPKLLKRESFYLKKKREERCRSRAGIEGLISHLKHDHRMIRNYLIGTAGDQTNTLLAAAAYNIKKWMRLKQQEILNLILNVITKPNLNYL